MINVKIEVVANEYPFFTFLKKIVTAVICEDVCQDSC